MTSYTPQPGTIAYRVIAYLQTLDTDAEVTTPVLLEAIGQPADWQGLSVCLETAVSHGVVGRRVEGRKAYWRLGGQHKGQGVDIARASAPVGTGTDCARSHPHENMSPACEAKTDVVRVLVKPILPEMDEAEPGPTPGPTTEDLADQLTDVVDAEFVEVAISNTGRLLISNGAQQMALSPAQTEKVFEYLDAHRGIEWQEAV